MSNRKRPNAERMNPKPGEYIQKFGDPNGLIAKEIVNMAFDKRMQNR